MDDPHKIPPFPSPGDRAVFPDRIRAFLELVRIPNVFTAVADVMMGYFVTYAIGHQAALAPFYHLGLLAGTSSLLYMAGMVLNDFFDAESDRVQRPSRPIPSGRIARQIAGLIGWELLLGGMAAAWLASFFADDWRPGTIGTLLATGIILYDRIMKQTPFGPAFMAACRGLNVLLGMSLIRLDGQNTLFGWSAPCWLIATGIAVYVYGITLLAKKESRPSDPSSTATSTGSRLSLITGTVVLFSGIALLAYLPNLADPIAIRIRQWWLLWLVLAAFIGWRCLRAIFHPHVLLIRAAVGHAIVSIIFLDAAVTAGLCGPFWGMIVLALALPTIVLRQWFEAT